MIEDPKVEWQARIFAGLLFLFGIAFFIVFLIWGVPLLKRILSTEIWAGAYGVLLVISPFLLLWVIWQNHVTAIARGEWAKIVDNQYNSLKEDLRDLKEKVEELTRR